MRVWALHIPLFMMIEFKLSPLYKKPTPKTLYTEEKPIGGLWAIGLTEKQQIPKRKVEEQDLM